MRFALIIVSLAFIIVSCTTQNQKPSDTKKEDKLNLVAATFNDLPGWQEEQFESFAKAFSKSCAVFQKKSSFKGEGMWGSLSNWKTVCEKFSALSGSSYKEFFEQNFTPYAITNNGDPEGLFTGYYEASLKGSRTRQGPYQYALRARPDDLIMVDLGAFREELKGQRIAGRVKNGNLKPYETRAEIENGELPDDQDKILVWVDDPVDAFFVQIQGSGIVQMDDGSVMRIGYAGQNGHVYYAIGRELIERGELTKDNVSMQSIRDWLHANPQEAEDVMNTNKSYVFFKELDGEGPVGGQGIALTPTRSLAIDHSLIPYGMPLWLTAEYPLEGYADIRRLMVTQDTGGAIRGPVRGDFFWGYGDFAQDHAGVMKSKGRYWVLLPKE